MKINRALEYDAKTSKAANIKAHCSSENITQKYQMSSAHAACTPINWPKDLQKYDIYTPMRKGYMSCYFQVNSQRQRTLEDTAVMCCFLMFDSSFVISYMRWKLKILQTVSRPLSLQIRRTSSSSATNFEIQ